MGRRSVLFRRVEILFDDFTAGAFREHADLLLRLAQGFLAQPRTRPEFELVVAERSDRWTPELRARARELPASAHVHYHELLSSGHWVHVDNPAALIELMAERLI